MVRSRTPQRRTTRQRMVDSAIVLLREKGAAGTTIDAVLAHSGAPRGSVYHHFPGGRRELLGAAATEAGEVISELIRQATTGADPRSALHRFADLWRATLVASDYRAGCPVLALVVDDGNDDPDVADIAARVLEHWHTILRDGLIAGDVDAARADRLATLLLSTIEGSLVLCRARRSAAPLDDVITELAPLLETGGPAT